MESPHVPIYDFINHIFNDELLSEIHKLLWIDPFNNKGYFDAGWSCREHALVVGCLLAARGILSQIVTGKNVFVRGPSNGKPPRGYGQDVQDKGTHMWLEIANYGVFDISPCLSSDRVPVSTWPPISFKGIFGNRWFPEGIGDYVQCESEISYSNQIARGSNIENSVQAIYWPHQRSELRSEMIWKAFDFTDSPLTGFLKKNFAQDIFAKAVMHFLDRLEGKGRSLARVSRNKGWGIIASRPGDAVEELLLATGLT